jgi:transketolase
MENNLSMRDAFLNRVYDFAKQDKDIIIISADLGAPSLDQIRDNLKNQFVNIGIAEQNMISVASGLASEGKKPFAFALGPFASSRCHEFIKINMGLMKYPVKIISLGSGVSYDYSGPTHHATEDISLIRAIPNVEIFSPSYSGMAKAFVSILYYSDKPSYIRLDRKILPDLSKYYQQDSFETGFKELEEGESIAIIATGDMVHKALEVQKILLEQGIRIGVIDIYRLNPLSETLGLLLSKYSRVISLEEHLLNGGLGSIISELITDNELNIKLKRMGLKNYCYTYGREAILKKFELDVESVVNEIRKLNSKN